MSQVAAGPHGEGNFFQSKLHELGATKRLKLAQIEALQQDIARLDQEERYVSESWNRYEVSQQVFGKRELWSQINTFIAPESGSLSHMRQVDKAWRGYCNQGYSTIRELQPEIDRLFRTHDWPHMNLLFALSSQPAMRMKVLYQTLKRAPADRDDSQRANLKRFVEQAAGIELLMHVGNAFPELRNVVIHICRILQCFDEHCDQKCGDSDPDESNGESESAVFISDKNMSRVALWLAAMSEKHATDDKVSALVKKTMHHLLFHEVIREDKIIQDILGGESQGTSFPFRRFTAQEIAERQAHRAQQGAALDP